MLVITFKNNQISNHLRVEVINRTPQVATLKHIKHGDYFINDKGFICYPDGEAYEGVAFLYEKSGELADKLSKSPNQELFEVNDFCFNELWHAKLFLNNKFDRRYIIGRYAV